MATAPTYSINDVVYLRSSAARGFIEAVRISGITQNATSGGWLYQIRIESKPPIGQTVGDYVDLKKELDFYLTEDELINFCAAAALVEQQLTRRLARIQAKRDELCSDTSGTTGTE